MAGTDPIRGLKDFDRVYMSAMKGTFDSISDGGLQDTSRVELKSKAKDISRYYCKVVFVFTSYIQLFQA